MRVVLRPLPVLYACRGCAEFGDQAREVAGMIERAKLAETAWLGEPGLKPKARFPIYALDGCGRGCARQWLEGHGIQPERAYVLQPGDEAQHTYETIAADLQ